MTELAAKRWRISGPLTAHEVPGLHAESRAQREREGLPSEIDLGAVEATDSSALALLLEWLSWARQSRGELAFLDPPASLRVIAELSDAHTLLGWTESEREDGEA